MSRRARVTPEQAGLYVLDGDVRRVPGLRREEVADLAGVSADYYTQLERGDVDGASDSVLTPSRAPCASTMPNVCTSTTSPGREAASRLAASRGAIRPSVQRTLDAFTGGMALVRNRRWDYLAANALGRAVYADIFDGRTGPPNHVRYVFLDDRARDFFDDWPAVAHDTARILRSEAGRDPHDPGPAELIEELSQTSAEFRAVWSQHDVRLPASGRHRFHHRARRRPRSRLRGGRAPRRPRPDASAGDRGTGVADRSGAAPAQDQDHTRRVTAYLARRVRAVSSQLVRSSGRRSSRVRVRRGVVGCAGRRFRRGRAARR